MDFTILAVVLLLCGGIPLRNKIYKERKILCVLALIVFAYWFFIKRNKK